MTRREGWRVVLLLSALTFLFAFPLTIRPFTHVLPVGPDGHLFLWTLAWNAHAFLAQPFHLFDANIYHPLPNTLAYSENLIGTSLIAAPILWITGNLTFALNAVSLVSVVLCGLGAYVLARRLGLQPAAACVAAVIFAFAPSRFFRIGQVHLAIHWLPFALAWLHAYFDTGRARDLRIALGFFTLQALTSGHGAVFLLVAGISLALFHLARGMPIAPGRRLRDVGLAGALVVLPVVLVQIPYWIARRDAGLRRDIDDWGVSHVSFLASPSHIWSAVLAMVPGGGEVNALADAFLFPGVLTLVLAGTGLVLARRLSGPLRQAVLFYGLVALLAYWLAVGPPIGLWRYLYWLPGLNFIREVSRFTMLGMLALAILAAAGVEAWSGRRSSARQRLLAGSVVTLLVVEFAAFPLTVIETPVEIPAVDRLLDQQPKPFVVAEVPLPRPADKGAFERRQTAYMLHSMAHWQKTVHGYSGIRQRLHVDLYDLLLGFPDEASIDRLTELGVTYVVVHGELYDPAAWPNVVERLEAFGNRLSFVAAVGPGRIYRLRER